MNFGDCVYVALDGMTRQKALDLTKKLTRSRYAHLIAGFKIHDLWDRYGPTIVRDLKKGGAKTIWLDLKLHDTSNTVLLRSQAARRAGADIVSVHAGSGVRGMRAAVSNGFNVVAITVLTSLDRGETAKIYRSSPRETVLRLHALAKQANCWGLVCSAQEIQFLPKRGKMKIIVPGIRMKKSSEENQKRTGTSREVLAMGADYIVLGSVITKARDPLATFEQIAAGLDGD